MKLIAQLAAAIALSVFGSFVMLDLYTWFVVPFGAPNLILAHVYGLMMLKGLILYRHQTKIEGPNPLVSYFLTLLVAWGLGAVAASFL